MDFTVHIENRNPNDVGPFCSVRFKKDTVEEASKRLEELRLQFQAPAYYCFMTYWEVVGRGERGNVQASQLMIER